MRRPLSIIQIFCLAIDSLDDALDEEDAKEPADEMGFFLYLLVYFLSFERKQPEVIIRERWIAPSRLPRWADVAAAPCTRSERRVRDPGQPVRDGLADRMGVVFLDEVPPLAQVHVLEIGHLSAEPIDVLLSDDHPRLHPQEEFRNVRATEPVRGFLEPCMHVGRIAVERDLAGPHLNRPTTLRGEERLAIAVHLAPSSWAALSR